MWKTLLSDEDSMLATFSICEVFKNIVRRCAETEIFLSPSEILQGSTISRQQTFVCHQYARDWLNKDGKDSLKYPNSFVFVLRPCFRQSLLLLVTGRQKKRNYMLPSIVRKDEWADKRKSISHIEKHIETHIQQRMLMFLPQSGWSLQFVPFLCQKLNSRGCLPRLLEVWKLSSPPGWHTRL